MNDRLCADKKKKKQKKQRASHMGMCQAYTFSTKVERSKKDGFVLTNPVSGSPFYVLFLL